MEQHLAALADQTSDEAAAAPVTSTRSSIARCRWLRSCSAACPDVGEAEQAVALEVMTRRYYRMRALGDLEAVAGPAIPMLRGTYDDGDGARVHVLTTTGSIDDLESHGRGRGRRRAVGDTGRRDRSCSICTLWSAGPLGDADELRRSLRAASRHVVAAVERAGASWSSSAASGVGPHELDAAPHVPMVARRASSRTTSCAGCTR